LSACATKATQPFERQLSLLTRSVTRPSLGPGARARRSSLTSPVKAVEGGASGEGSRLGKPGNRRNQHRHLVRRTKRGSTRIHLSQGSNRMRLEKEGGCGLRPFEDHESPGRSARTSVAVAEVVQGDIWSRISPRAAPSKRERGGSERGPRSGRASAVTRRRARRAKRCRHVDPSPSSLGRRSAEAQGGVRTPFTGRNFARKAERRSRDRGSRIKAAFATGSYEGSLTMEGIPGSHEPSFFTVRWSRRSWRLPHRPVHGQPPLSPTRRRDDPANTTSTHEGA